MSTVLGPQHEPGRAPPDACGWRSAVELAAGQTDGLAVVRSGGRCSFPNCDGSTTAAIRRGPSRRRLGFWQAYCYQHALDRGVSSCGSDLRWVDDGFIPIAPDPRR